MHRPASSGFILPFALILASALILLAVLLLKFELAVLERESRLQVQRSAETHLRQQVPVLVEALGTRLRAGNGASAVRRLAPAAGPDFRAFWQEGGQALPLHSHVPASPVSPALFPAQAAAHRLAADWVFLTPPGAPIAVALAWTAEDVALLAPAHPPPEFWPLPQWELAPVREPFDSDGFLDDATRSQWRSLPWIAAQEPLPFRGELSPALAPVVTRLALRFGLFAAGHPSRTNKTVRVRFHIEGELWNPYNRPLRLHSGAALRGLFQALFWNLPEIRLHNRTLGVSSDWIPLDSAQNAGSGVQGLQAWIRAPGDMPGGQRHAFVEPDPSRQPEGLARTLHSAFPVRPADRIEVELRQPAGGLYAACLPLQDGDSLDAALAGHGWFRIEGFPVAWPGLVFHRADSGDRPFLLESGSLSYRMANAHLRVGFSQPASLLDSGMDPRRRAVVHGELFQNASGTWEPQARLRDTRIDLAPGNAVPTGGMHASAPLALFSWPATAPASLREAADLPFWSQGFRLGSAGADAVNAVLDRPGAMELPGQPDNLVSLTSADGQRLTFTPAIPVNLADAGAWETLLRASARMARPSGELHYPTQLVPYGDDANGILAWDPAALATAADRITAGALSEPLAGPAAFFNSGRLEEAFPQRADSDPVHRLLPLRGWLRAAPALRAHGSGWILHIAVRAEGEQLRVQRSARIWLLETPGGAAGARLEIIRFEWDPQDSPAPPTPG
jgi:hypothetical protein